jgi:hypothetical protein
MTVILKRNPKRIDHSTQRELIDLLDNQGVKIDRTAVLDAIDFENNTALARILERRNGKLDFDANELFEDPRFGYRYGRHWVNFRRTCTAYAEFKKKDTFVSLLKNYGWRSDEIFMPPRGFLNSDSPRSHAPVKRNLWPAQRKYPVKENLRPARREEHIDMDKDVTNLSQDVSPAMTILEP